MSDKDNKNGSVGDGIHATGIVVDIDVQPSPPKVEQKPEEVTAPKSPQRFSIEKIKRFISGQINAFELLESETSDIDLDEMRRRVGRLKNQISNFQKKSDRGLSHLAIDFLNGGYFKNLDDYFKSPQSLEEYLKKVAEQVHLKYIEELRERIWSKVQDKLLDYRERKVDIFEEFNTKGISYQEVLDQTLDLQKNGFNGQKVNFKIENAWEDSIRRIEDQIAPLSHASIPEQMAVNFEAMLEKSTKEDPLVDKLKSNSDIIKKTVSDILSRHNVTISSGEMRGTGYNFMDGKTTIYTIQDWVEKSDDPNFRKELIDSFYKDYFNAWFIGDLKMPHLIPKQEDIKKTYGQSNRRKGMENFIQNLNIGVPKPSMKISHRAIELEGLPNDKTEEFSLTVTNPGRGYLIGEVDIEGEKSAPGLELLTRDFDGKEKMIRLSLDMTKVGVFQKCHAQVLFKSNGEPEQVKVPITYNQVPPTVDITHDNLDLGDIPNDKVQRLNIRIQNLEQGKLKGSISIEKTIEGVGLSFNTVNGVIQQNHDFDQNDNQFILSVSPEGLVEGDSYSTKLIVTTNGNVDKKEIDISFSILKPIPVATPDKFEEFSIKNNESLTKSFVISNTGEGLLKSEVHLAPHVPGLNLDKKEFKGNNTKVTLKVDGNAFRGKEGQTIISNIVVQSNGNPGEIRIPIQIRISIPKTSISVTEIDLGKLEYNTAKYFEFDIIETDQGLTYGKIVINPPNTPGLILEGRKGCREIPFSGAKNVKLGCHSSMLPKDSQNVNLEIQTNGEPRIINVPVKYQIASPVKKILLGALKFSLVGAAFGAIVRLFLMVFGFTKWLGGPMPFDYLKWNVEKIWPISFAFVILILATTFGVWLVARHQKSQKIINDIVLQRFG